MATILRTWSYRYPWLYNTISQLSALAVGGEARFRQLALESLPIETHTTVLDLCCGGGQTTRFLVQQSQHVIGLDLSPKALDRARQVAPQATYVEGLAENLPFADGQFDLVHTSVALHEMTPPQLEQILREVHRVLRPGGWFAAIDLHWPTNPLFIPGLTLFMALFETETAWTLINTDLVALLGKLNLPVQHHQLHAGGSLQVIQAQKQN